MALVKQGTEHYAGPRFVDSFLILMPFRITDMLLQVKNTIFISIGVYDSLEQRQQCMVQSQEAML